MTFDTRKRRLALAATFAAALLAACGGGSDPSTSGPSEGPSRVGSDLRTRAFEALRLPAGADTSAAIAPSLRGAKGPVDVWVTLADSSLAVKKTELRPASPDRSWRDTDDDLKARLKAQKQLLKSKQDSAVGSLAGMGGRELGRVHVAHNAVAVKIDASRLKEVAALAGVLAVRPVLRYELMLGETVPYVGGMAVQASGWTGAGVKVAVLDSGIDYTHKNLGGAGTAAAYEAAWGTSLGDSKQTTRDGLFPTAKVVGGYDFVGEDWPNSPEAPDEDPIDLEGHGTHVADIIAGASLDGTHKGMAPGASLVAVKVCSAVATSCSGIALLQGMDYALDPNGDGDTSDAVDVINMSLGSAYGQIEDDLTLAAANAVKLGVVVVVSAGNSANRPYVVGSPSTAVGVISVAQTQVPSATAVPLVVNTPALIAGVYGNTATMDFAPIGGGVTGDVVFVGRGCPGDAYSASPAGKIALIDRGACSVSLKIDLAAKAGATGVLIGLVAPGDAVSFSYGGGDTFVPSLVIQQSLSTAIKGRLGAGNAVNVSISNAASIPLVGSMASSSSRGPAMSTQDIKPEIGAPGASLSAEVGTGTEQTAFGGTSGAAPMVAGAAALLVEAYPKRSPEVIKAMLMNTAETVVYTNPALAPGELAPITRVGAGELRVSRAIGRDVVAWNPESKSAALSFGALEVDKKVTVVKTLRVKNLSDVDKFFTVTPGFRYADDEASGAVRVNAPSQVRVAARSHEDVEVKLVIDPSLLPSWTLNGGSQGGNGAALNGPEYDGYVTLTAGAEKLSVPWHVLPRRAAANVAQWEDKKGSALAVRFKNKGQEVAQYDVFSLMATSKKLPKSALPQPGDNFAAVDLRAVGVRYLAPDVCGGGCLEFAISTNGRRAHPAYPGGFEVDIDTNGDGTVDYFVYNGENGGFNATGQTLIFAQKVGATTASAFFYADADLNSGNMIMTVPMGALGLTVGTTINFSVVAYDNYFSGLVSDELTGLRFTPGLARFNTVGAPFGIVAAKSGGVIDVSKAKIGDAASSEIGLLLMHRSNTESEADILRAK